MNNKAYITKASSFLPNSPVSNDQMEDILGYVAGKPSRAKKIVLKQNKIQTRYYVLDPKTRKQQFTNAQLSALAIKKLEDENFSIKDISCLVTATSLVEHLMPNHGVMVHGELATPTCEVVTTAGICLSGLTAIKYGYLGVLSGEHKNAVASASEMLSPSLKAENYDNEIEEKTEKLEARPILAFEKDFLRWMLSDGAGSVLIESSPKDSGISLEIDWIDLYSYANELDTCMYCGADKNTANGVLEGWASFNQSARSSKSIMAIKQDVKLLNENMAKYGVKSLKKSLEKHNFRCEDVDYLLPHISSYYFKDQCLKGIQEANLDLPEEKWFVNLSKVGNVGAASIYLMIDELVNTKNLEDGQKILCFVPESGRFSYGFMMLTVVKK